MPEFTDADKLYTLQQQGISNPDDYQIDYTSGAITPKVKQQPTFNTKPLNVNPSIVYPAGQLPSPTGPIGTGIHAAAQSIVPTATGLAGGLGGGALGTALVGAGGLALAPETMGASLIPLIAGLGGALGGGYLGSKLQGAIEPQEWQDQLAQEAQQHPIASTIGGFVPAMAAFNPIQGAKNLVIGDTGKLLGEGSIINSAGKLLGRGGNSITAGQKADLINSALNMGTAAGQNIYEQSQSQEPFSYGSLALNTGLASILNSPNKLGKAVGFHSGNEIDAGLAAQRDRYLASLKKVQDIVNPSTTPNAAQPDVGDIVPHFGSYPAVDATGKPIMGPVPEAPIDPITGQPVGPIPLSEGMGQAINPAANQQALIQQAKEYPWIPPNKRGLANYNPDEDPIVQGYRRRQAQDEAIEEAARNTKEAELNRYMAENQITQPAKPAEPAFIQNPAGEETTIPKKDYTGTVEQSNKEVQEESPEDLRMRQLEGLGDKYSSPEETPHPYNNLNWKQLPPTFKQKVLDLAQKRGISIDQARTIIDPRTGQEKLGVYRPATREATVSSSIGRGDTGPHEIGHGFMEDLASSNVPADQMLYKRALNIFGGDPKMADEMLAKQLGKNGNERIFNSLEGSALGKFKSFFSDYIARQKYNLGLANDKDTMQYLSQRLHTDAPYGMRGEIPLDNTKPRYIGTMGPHKLYNLQQDMTDKEGVVHPKGSTVAEKTLKDNNIKYQDESELPNYDSPTRQEQVRSEILRREEESGRPIQESQGSSKETSGSGILQTPEGIKIPEESHINETGDVVPNKINLGAQKLGGSIMQFDREKDPAQGLYQKLTKGGRMSSVDAEVFIKSLGLENYQPKYSSESALKGGVTPSTVNLGSRQEELRAIDRSPITTLPYKTFGPTRSLLDAIRMKQGSEGSTLADAIAKTHEERASIKSKYMYPIDVAAKSATPEDQQHVYNTLLAESRANKSFRDQLQNGEQEQLYDATRDRIKQKQLDQISDGQPIHDWDTNGKPIVRQAKVDPFYFPARLDPNVLKEMQENPKSDFVKNIKNDFLEYNKERGNTIEQAQAKWDALQQGQTVSNKLGLRGEGGSENYFKANRESQGVGLPDSMIRKESLVKTLNGYFTKVANDRAFYRNIESQPDVAKSIGMKKDAWGEPIQSEATPIGGKDVLTAMEELHGEGVSTDERNVKAMNRLATSFMLGPMTNMHITGSSIANQIAITRPGESVATLKHVVTHLGEGMQHAFQTGYAQRQYTHIGDIFKAGNTFAEKLGAAANFVNNLSGRQLVEKGTKALLQSANEFLIPLRIEQARQGDKQAINLLNHIDPKFDYEKPYTDQEKIQLASNLSGMIHGMHDARTLPRWMLHDSAIQPFFALASWNVAQTNNFMRNVYTPALKGNYTPLVMATLGAGLGGYVLKELREGISNKQAPFPSIFELSKTSKGIEGNIPLVAYNLMHMASLSGFGGVLSMMGKAGFDAAYKNMPQGASFPLDEVMSGAIKTMHNAGSAMLQARNIDEYLHIGMKASIDLAKEQIQLARIAHTWLVQEPGLAPEQLRQQKINRAQRDIRAYKMGEGQPYEEQTAEESNPYLNLPYKAYKRTENINEAAKMLPDLMNTAMERAQGNPEILKSELNKIKVNKYDTMPSLENTPVQFIRYLNYLKGTKGPEAATDRMKDYLKQNMVNQIKSELVPSI